MVRLIDPVPLSRVVNSICFNSKDGAIDRLEAAKKYIDEIIGFNSKDGAIDSSTLIKFIQGWIICFNSKDGAIDRSRSNKAFGSSSGVSIPKMVRLIARQTQVTP